MVHRCCIPSCGMNVRVSEAKGLSFHLFPNKEPVRDQWIQAILPHMDKPECFKIVSGYTRVCSRHFRKKDYSLDIKKRARLNSSAVPSVFPRKNSPVIVQNIVPSKQIKSESLKSNSVPSTSHDSDSSAVTEAKVTNAVDSVHTTLCDDTLTVTDVSTSLPKNLLIESATIADDQLILTVLDPYSIQSTEEYTTCDGSLDTESDNTKSPKRRKRRKWNRTAFCRPAKGKRRNTSTSLEDSNLEGVGEAFAEISITNFLNMDPGQEDNSQSNQCNNVSEDSGLRALEPIAFPLENVAITPLHSNTGVPSSVEQELLQSIQAVSLHGGDGENESQTAEEQLTLTNLSLVSHLIPTTRSESNSAPETPLSISGSVNERIIDSNNDLLGLADSNLVAENEDFISQMTRDLNAPSTSEIEKLASHFYTSLLRTSIEPDIKDESCVSVTIPPSSRAPGYTANVDSCCSDEHIGSTTESTESDEEDKLIYPPNSRRKVKLTGVAKRRRKEKLYGRFSVKRFKDSDKDIEYYTGFKSYKSFISLFRSLEIYVEKLRVTDIMHGASKVDELQSLIGLAPEEDPAIPTADASKNKKAKKRHPQGRCMPRIDELFMTVMRLKRKLPEKVLGHMFYISQPSVSRIVRAWTMLLSKVIESQSSQAAKVKRALDVESKSEEDFANRPLSLPESFCQLFHNDLAKSIILAPSKSKCKKAECRSRPKSSAESSTVTCDTTPTLSSLHINDVSDSLIPGGDSEEPCSYFSDHVLLSSLDPPSSLSMESPFVEVGAADATDLFQYLV